MLVGTFFRHYLFSRRAGALVRKISWLCIIGVSVGVSALIIVMSVMKGLNARSNERLLSIEPHLVITPTAGQSLKDIENSELAEYLKKQGHRVHAFESQDVILRTGRGLFRGAVARGVSEESLDFILKEIRRLNQREAGRTLDTSTYVTFDEPTIPGKNEVIMGVDVARSIDILEGESVAVIPPESLLLPTNEIPMTERVSASRILETKLADIDAQVIFYIRGQALNRFAETASRRIGLEVWTAKPMDVGSLQEDIKKFPGFESQTWYERNSALLLALRLELFVMGTFLAMAALISSFSIVTVLSLLISQKTKEIGILMCMGLSRKQIQKLFSRIGLILAALGLGIGLLIGLSVSLYIESHPLKILPSLYSDIYYDADIPAQVSYLLIATVIVAGALIAWVSTYYSTKSIAALEPSEALRVKN